MKPKLAFGKIGLMTKLSICAAILATSTFFSASANAQEAEQPDTLTVAMMWESNPLSIQSRRSRFFNESEVLDTLVKLDYDMSLKPGLATSWERLSDNEWLFTLREGVKFHDGSDLTAESVINSLNNVMRLLPYAPRLLDIAKMEAVGTNKVKITTNKPFVGLPNQLTDAFTGIYAPASFDAEGNYLKPIGTGPYKFDSYTKQDRTIVDRFDGYWGKKPTIKKVVYRYIPDHNARSLALEAGEIDMAVDVLPADVKRLTENPNFTVNRAPTAGLYYLVLNTASNSPFSDVRVREAVNLMIDRDALVNYSLDGVGIPAWELFSPGFKMVTGNVPKYSLDLGKAQKLLKQAGYNMVDKYWTKDGKPLTLKLISYTSRAEMQTITETIANMLAQNGIKATVEMYTWPAMQELTTKGNYDAYAVYWAPEMTGDPDTYLRAHYTSNSNMMNNGYSNPKIDKLLAQARGQGNKKERNQSYNNILQIIRDDVPVIPLVHRESVIATNNHVKGFKIHPSGFFFDFKNVTKE